MMSGIVDECLRIREMDREIDEVKRNAKGKKRLMRNGGNLEGFIIIAFEVDG